MMRLKYSAILLNVILFGFVCFILADEGLPKEPFAIAFVALLIMAPLVNWFYIYKENDGMEAKKEDSLFSLWLKVRKKKLEDELTK
jgi:hypothetical protein|tara:strand:- start:4230 stop:4487 length:258 start_codon:yes stop_codon:yes gene_type:complete